MIYNGYDGQKVNLSRTEHGPTPPLTPSAPLRPLQTIPSPQQPRQQNHATDTRSNDYDRQNHVIQKWQAQHDALTSKAKTPSKPSKAPKQPHTPQPKPSPFRVKQEQPPPPSTPPLQKKRPPPTPISRIKAKKLLKAEPMNKNWEVGCIDYKKAMKDSTSWNKRILKGRRTRMPYFDVHTGTAHNNSHLYRTRQMRLPRGAESQDPNASRDYLVKYEGRRWRSSKPGFDFYSSLPASWLRFPINETKPKQSTSSMAVSASLYSFRDSSNDGFPNLASVSSNSATSGDYEF